ncbi:MAG: hypothetical protein DPW18_02430 [Chloroflexi bacterium]|nr:hypothetical protein [Chloroflexota bacterium]MDL1942708.1 hypothetical protein [Chloroflexi bacterium CFX2]
MFKRFSKPGILLLLFGGAAVFTLLAWFGWKAYRLGQIAKSTAEPVFFAYCGADLEDLCVLSFGRDGDGNTIVNLFVPEKKFPAFYLLVERVTGESRYECDKNDDVPTIVWCIGASINLDERIEIRILSKKDDRLLAKGRFTVTAVLIASAPTAEGSSELGASTPRAGNNTQVPTRTLAPGETPPPGGTPAPTSTAATPGYPNYP